MKTIYQFVYCADKLHPNVVWYSVAVGTGKRSRRAFAELEKLASSSSSFLLQKKSLASQAFQDRCAASMFPEDSCAGKIPVHFLRQQYVPVEILAKFLRECPPVFLNAEISPFEKKR